MLMESDHNGVQRGLIIWVKEVPTLKFSCETFRAVYTNDTLMKNKKDKNVHIIPIYLYEGLQSFSLPFLFSFFAVSPTGVLLSTCCPARAALAELVGGGGRGQRGLGWPEPRAPGYHARAVS